MIDLLVVGAGPAGLATALYANRAGLDVVVLDSREAPIDKACGEGLMPGALSALTELGVELNGHPFRGIRYLAGSQRAEATFRHGSGMGVRRTDLHAALMVNVVAAGIPVLHQTVGGVHQDDHSVSAAGFRARYLAAADGLHSPIRAQLGLHRAPPARRQPRWGQRQHFAVPPWTDFVEVYWSAQSELYVTPVGPNLVGVAVLSSARSPFGSQLADFPSVVSRLPASGTNPVRGAGPLLQRTKQRVAGRVLLVGDAAGYVDAITGEGISVALACAKALVDCVSQDQPRRYEERWRQASRSYRLMTASLLWARRTPPLGRALVPGAARAPWLFEAGVHQLAK